MIPRGDAQVSGRSPASEKSPARPDYRVKHPRFDPHSKSQGILLLDMALALAILLLLFAIIWPTFGNGSTNLQQSATALNIATLLRSDRTTASRTGVPTGTSIDLDRRTLTSATGRSIKIPADIALEVTTGTACMTSVHQFVIAFAPDGSSCGGIIVLKKRSLSYAVRFNWLSGMIDVVHTPKT
jgi:general secretion pathway protein H